ncbi:MAG TPA: nucleoside triphosphate pyrophosphatase [Myxococcales bacterium]|jgi:septum formation protein
MADGVYQRTDVPDLVLASTSRFRRQLLEAAALPFRAVAPEVDEAAPASRSPKQLARALALKKAQAVSLRFPGALVIGSDQTAELDGRLLRKPHDRAEARRQLSAMSGRVHFLHTGVALVRGGPPRLRKVAVVSARLALRELTRREIEAYLDTGEWEGCAGSYRIEAQGLKLMREVRGEHSAIIGLPMVPLVRMLSEAGFPLFAPRSSRGSR